MQDRIRVETSNGDRLEGRTDGEIWVVSEGGSPQPALDLVGDDGTEQAVFLDDIVMAQAIHGREPKDLLAAVIEVLGDPAALGPVPWEGFAVVGRHFEVDVEIRLTRRPCWPRSSTPSETA